MLFLFTKHPPSTIPKYNPVAVTGSETLNMDGLQASLPPCLIPGLSSFPLVWVQLQEHNICVCVDEKDRRKATGRGKRDLSKDGASPSCHSCHLPAPVWADGNRAPLGDGSATHSLLPTAFGSHSFTPRYLPSRHDRPSPTITHSTVCPEQGRRLCVRLRWIPKHWDVVIRPRWTLGSVFLCFNICSVPVEKRRIFIIMNKHSKKPPILSHK